VRGGVDGVDEPGGGSDRGGDADGEVLGELERLEVVEDDALVEASFEVAEGAGEEEEAVTAETGGQTRDGGGGASHGACDLAMGGAGLQAGGDGSEQLGALEVVGGGERLA